ncbi:hypothetical protein [Metabacillus malikii]|uniref:Membrane protein n=1 Tax=Metabacillus malikii TaxID=1504265 RepID=A0ABT9ZH44_9BACI|nr:hypothetical protein [Metabacillus malikii]MDQ0231612.1 putative membrane protein [Metabacillus malikii]
MNNNVKKKVIINEISYWKHNKLLPETYCDFLLALYTEGNHEENQLIPTENNRSRKYISYFIISFLAIVSLLVIYFTELSFVLQMTLVGFLLIFSIVVTAYLFTKKENFQFSLSLTFLQLLIFSIHLIERITEGTQVWLGLAIIGNCLLWIIFGSIYRYVYLIISGSVGLIVLTVFIII